MARGRWRQPAATLSGGCGAGRLARAAAATQRQHCRQRRREGRVRTSSTVTGPSHQRRTVTHSPASGTRDRSRAMAPSIRAPYDARTGPSSVRTTRTPISRASTQPTSTSRRGARAAVKERAPVMLRNVRRAARRTHRVIASADPGDVAAAGGRRCRRAWRPAPGRVVRLRGALLLRCRALQRRTPRQHVLQLEPLEPLEAGGGELLLRPDLVEGGVQGRADEHRDGEQVEPQQHRDRSSQRAVDRGGARGGADQHDPQQRGAEDPAEHREHGARQVVAPARPHRHGDVVERRQEADAQHQDGRPVDAG